MKNIFLTAMFLGVTFCSAQAQVKMTVDASKRGPMISQYQYAWEMGYDSPDEKEPRVSLEDQFSKGNSDPQEGTKKKQRQDDKNQSARRSRDKTNPSPSRGDQNTKPR